MIMITLLLVSYLSLFSAEACIKFAAVIYRHGDRTPVDTYPTDPWRNESLWPVKFGELTSIGKRQHYALGQWLRKRYSHLLSEEFDPTEIYVRSTDVDRTLMSAEANLAGMYPPKGKYIWNDNLIWQPVPVHTVPEKQDAVLAMKKSCSAYDKEMCKFLHSEAYQEKLESYKDLMNYLSIHTGKNITDFYGIEEIYSILHIEKLYNFTLPNWTVSVYPDVMHKPACYSFATAAATPLLARLKAGPLMKEIISNMIDASNEMDYYAHNVHIYSGHDFTIGNILTALGVYDGNCPVYTATLLIELIQENATSSHHIRISYRNSIDIREPVVLFIPNCGTSCPLDRFIKLYENLVTVNFKHDCNLRHLSLYGVPMFIILTVIILTYGLNKVCYQKNQINENFIIGFQEDRLMQISKQQTPTI